MKSSRKRATVASAPGSNAVAPLRSLETLRLDHRFARLPAPYYSVVPPTPLPDPRLVSVNPDAAALIDLDPAEMQRPEFVAIMAGHRPLPGGTALATLYAGHQFGAFVPQLGDGRAILIGQVRNDRGELWDLQLKGAGKTPYSRFGDGRAVLRSTVREYLCGEALHGLGIPTTRALCIVGSSEPVQRETVETAAVLCRLAQCHLRFGHFEAFYYGEEHDRLAPLADHVIEEYFPHLVPPARAGTDGMDATLYASWLGEVVERTARLMAQWQAVGFCHGVMNTDNMSITGLTLDYGPYGFMDAFDAHHICNHTDEMGRYAYDQQPAVGYWNCSRLLQATLPLLDSVPEQAALRAQGLLERFAPAYGAESLKNWRSKLGLRTAGVHDVELINTLLKLLDRTRADFTRSFRSLSRIRTDRDDPMPDVCEDLHDRMAFDAWVQS
ncbi:MAG: YdiU family protein, partial [Nevskiales bacterium]|nr:YdiU family protein [Nevskiales bacterium]